MRANELSRGTVTCPPTVEEHLQELEEAKRKRWAERQMLVTELTAAKWDLEDLNKELLGDKVFRVQTETEKLEAVEVDEARFQKLDKAEGLRGGLTLS